MRRLNVISTIVLVSTFCLLVTTSLAAGLLMYFTSVSSLVLNMEKTAVAELRVAVNNVNQTYKTVDNVAIALQELFSVASVPTPDHVQPWLQHLVERTA